MAALTAPDFIRSTEPGYRGRLPLSLFPGYTLASLSAFLDALLLVAYAEPRVVAAPTEAEKNRLAEAYVYASAYDEALLIAALRPTEISLDDLGTRKVDIKTLTGILSGWRKEWLAAWNETPAEAAAGGDTNESVTVRLGSGW